MFEKCINCGTHAIVSIRAGGGTFCSKQCRDYYQHPDYCRACMAGTTQESAGGTTTVNGVGTKLYGSKSPCPQCGSIIQTKFFCFLLIPVIPLGKYRVKWVSPRRYLSRKLNPAIPQL